MPNFDPRLAAVARKTGPLTAQKANDINNPKMTNLTTKRRANMFCYQKDVKKSSTAKCLRGDFWREVRSQKTEWHINARRAIKAAVKADLDGEGVAAIHT